MSKSNKQSGNGYEKDAGSGVASGTGNASGTGSASQTGNAGSAGNAGNTNRASFSLVMKLNLHTIFYTFGVLLTVNILLCLAVLSFTLWKAEDNAASLMEGLSPKDETVIMDYSFQPYKPSAKEPLWIALWDVIHEKTPLADYKVLRRVWLDTENGYHLSELIYQMTFEEQDMTVTYRLGSVLEEYLYPLYGLLILEGLILISGIGKGRRRVRRILRPLTEMSRQAQNLSSSSAQGIPADEMKRLRELAGTISNIDATKLDKRLAVDGTQSELKDLANAINSMLNRIDEAYRSQVRFVSDASHELRTPISVIQGYVNLLDRWGKNDEATTQEAIDAIKSEAENMKELVEQLLFLARGDNETLRLDLEAFDCSEMIGEIFKETQMIDQMHTFRVRNSSPAFVSADRQLMKQALRILIDNSIKYTPYGGEILVSVTTEDGMVRISVQDNGIGIDPENLPYIFDRFYRSDESRARKTGGSGLGLAIMKWIVDRHGGTIEVISRKDIGTRTTILLPKVQN
ncbi:MAG TPA: HAMP domain-containing sensor histidine kinase [Anaerovoracaceae bacterium]|nr:HAMP domain-containing sensor histidine kinase [Anaerovoracaceae bacterium]